MPQLRDASHLKIFWFCLREGRGAQFRFLTRRLLSLCLLPGCVCEQYASYTGSLGPEPLAWVYREGQRVGGTGSPLITRAGGKAGHHMGVSQGRRKRREEGGGGWRTSQNHTLTHRPAETYTHNGRKWVKCRNAGLNALVQG